MPEQPEVRHERPGPEPGFLVSYLASNDAPCPACGYNLRGCTGSACPECGALVTLGIAGRPRHWVPPVLAFLAFGWVFVAGALNTTRNVHWVYSSARNGASMTAARVQGFNIQLYPRLLQDGGGAGSDLTYLGIPLVQPAPTGLAALSWASVPDSLWWQSAWSVGLLVGGAVGVGLMVRHRRRALSERGWGLVRVFALALFGIYGGYHVYMFSGEVAGW